VRSDRSPCAVYRNELRPRRLGRGGWRRRTAYRLANRVPFDLCPRELAGTSVHSPWSAVTLAATSQSTANRLAHLTPTHGARGRRGSSCRADASPACQRLTRSPSHCDREGRAFSFFTCHAPRSSTRVACCTYIAAVDDDQVHWRAAGTTISPQQVVARSPVSRPTRRRQPSRVPPDL